MPLKHQHLLLACVLFVVTTDVGCSQQSTSPTQAIGNQTTAAESPQQSPPAESIIQAAVAEEILVSEPLTDGIPDSTKETEPQYRIVDETQELNRQRLSAAGIHVLESRRLILLTDVNPVSVQDLPLLADYYFDYLENVCGRLRPSRSDTEFQATGCLISDFQLFQSLGLVPGPVIGMHHGQQFGYRFWIREQTEDYYRRHLLLHEFAHVYMTCDTGLSDIPDGWFMEGAAEVFATHATVEGTTLFGLLPKTVSGFEGWGRISTIKRQRMDPVHTDFMLQTIPSMDQLRFPKGTLAGDNARYAWWWAFSWMLGNHPDYADEWIRLCRCRGTDEFRQQIRNLENRHKRLATDWLLFAESLCENFDRNLSFPQHSEPDKLPHAELTLRANRSWQDTSWELTANTPVMIECSGTCVVEQTTAPWISEPNGVTLEYKQGRPLGEVVAVLVSPGANWISRRIAVGKRGIITTPRPGRLWMQINDSANSRNNNSGSYHIRISQHPALNNNSKSANQN